MLGKIPSLISAAAKGLAASGSSDWISDEQKEKAVQDIEEARQYANEQQRNMTTQNPLANTLGNFAGTALQYGAVNGALEGTAAANALTEKLGEHGANLVLGEAADIALDTIPTEVENYENGMRGTDLAADTLKNLGVNAAFNLGAEGLGMIPGLLKGMKKPTEEIAEEAVETAAKSAPDAIKQVENVVEPEPIKQLNPVDVARQNAEVEELAYRQQREAADAIDALGEQIPQGDIAKRASMPTDDISIAKHQADIGIGNVQKFKEITENDAVKELDKRGVITDILNNYPNIKRQSNAPKKSKELIESEIKNLNKQMDDYAHGRMNSNALFDCGTTPGILKENGIKGDRIMMSQKVYDKITLPMGYKEGKHGLGREGVEKTIRGLGDPAVTMISDKGDGVSVIINYTDKNGAPVFVPMTIGKDGVVREADEILSSSKIKSAHVRNRLDNYIKNRAAQITYIKGEDEVLSNGFWNAELKSSSPNNNIQNPLSKVNTNFDDIVDSDKQFITDIQKNKAFSDEELNGIKGDLKKLKQSFNGKVNYIKDGGNEYAVAFKKSLDDLAKNPNADTYSTARAALNEYIEHSRTPRMKANSSTGDWYTKVWDNYNPETKSSQFTKAFDDFADKYGLRNTEPVQNTAGLKQLAEPTKPGQIPEIGGNKLALDLQYFADKAEEARKALNNMPEGAEKEQFRDSLEAFEAKLRNAKTVGEAEQAWELSKVRKTMEKSGIFTEDELKNVIPEDDLKYMRQGEEVPYNAVKKRIADDYDGMLARYTQKFDSKEAAVKELGNAEDINGMYIMAKDRLEKARATDNMAEKRQLYAEARNIMLNNRRANTELGRAVQANAKIARTPERSVMDALGYAEDKVNKALDKDPNLKKGIEQVTEQIDNFLHDMDVDAMSREEIESMIDQALLMNKRVRQRISKGDIRKIADAILEEKQYCDIQKQLEFLSTGYGDVDAKTMEQVRQMFEDVQDLPFNSKKRVDMENEAYKLLATTISPNGGSFRDKFDAWRYLAMLANPTTHIKNMTGNLLFGKGMVSAKNTLGALIEEAADRVSKVAGKGGIDRTKAILTTGDAGLIEAAKKDGLENAFRDLSGSKYLDAARSIDQSIPAFSTKNAVGRGINKASEVNNGLLSAEDEMAMLSKYKTSLAGFLKANGADESIFKATDDQSKSLLENARAYAINQAKEAAFHQDNATADLFSQSTRNFRDSESKVAKAVGLAGDIIVPFKKTPANILKSAFEYSPLEYAKVITDINALKKGTIKAADLIDDISKATTGTAALGIGAILAHEGILKIGSDLSDEEESFDKQTGRQTVSIKVGDRYVPIQELIPAAAPLIFGGTIYETMANKTDGDTALNTLFAGTGAIANGTIEMSMLSGITDTLSSVRGAKDDKEVITNLGLKTGANLASQLLPTLGRKANVTIDDTKRSTYSDKTGAAKQIDQNLKYLQTKLPGSQQLGEALKKSDNQIVKSIGNRLALEPNIDVKGQVQESPGHAGINNIGGRVINNFLSPVNVTQDTSTKYDEERRRLSKETGETKVLPYIASTEAKIDDVPLSPSDWTEYRKTRGQLREKLAEGIIDSPAYKDLSDEDKAALLVDADSFSKAYAQSKYGKEMKSENKKLAEIYEKDGVKGVIDSLNTKVQLDKYGLDNTDKNQKRLAEFSADKMKDYAAYKEKESAYKESNDIENLKKTDKIAVLRGMPLSAQKELLPDMIESQEDKKRWEAAGHDVTRYWKLYDAAEKKAQQAAQAVQNEIKSAGIGDAEQTQKELASYGAIDSPSTVEYYAKAKKVIPSLTTKEYAGYLYDIGGSDYKINQEEFLTYANKNKLPADKVKTYWNAFGEWKTIPKLIKGQWKASRK